jgi:PAS domain S-box-containing protein
MTQPDEDSRTIDPDVALRRILEGTAVETGPRFFERLVESLARTLDTPAVWVTEYVDGRRRLRALAFWLDGALVPDFAYDLAGTPCEAVVDRGCVVTFAADVVRLFPDDADLRRFDAVSYMGAPLLDADGTVIGNLAIFDRRPFAADERVLTVLRVFADRAAGELRRLRAEAAVREREAHVRGLLESAMDAVVETDARGAIALVNRAAEGMFDRVSHEMVGTEIGRLFDEPSAARIRASMREIDERPEDRRRLWLPRGLEARDRAGRTIAIDATLSRHDVRGAPYYTLILRNLNDRLEAERRIATLAEEAASLRQTIGDLEDHGEIVGGSPAIRQVLAAARQVADTDASVLIHGETGTGKELIARAIHAASGRHAKPLVTVNCGAIAPTLVESEFFGHEKGAFTGATERRQGRFVLADGGTIFLDEVGELSVEMQVKLLRVLQEGELEPVGSSRTRTVDVRVIAATHRDLAREVREGRFRQDLYYRLAVFPLHVPPLRERREDIPLLAATFVERIARRLRRRVEPPSNACLARLVAYEWPGNVRELQNVIERAVITAVDGRLDIARALPVEAALPPAAGGGILTADELVAVERANLLRALEHTGWRVAGADGAAALLGLKPSTLASRMKALGIARATTP